MKEMIKPMITLNEELDIEVKKDEGGCALKVIVPKSEYLKNQPAMM